MSCSVLRTLWMEGPKWQTRTSMSKSLIIQVMNAMLPVFSNALSHRTHANMKRTGFDFILWLLVVLFVAKIPAGIKATKSSTDGQGKFLQNSRADVKSVSSLIHACYPAYVYTCKHTYANSCWMTNHFLSLAEWTYNENAFSYYHSYTRTHTQKHSISLNEESFSVTMENVYCTSLWP